MIPSTSLTTDGTYLLGYIVVQNRRFVDAVLSQLGVLAVTKLFQLIQPLAMKYIKIRKRDQEKRIRNWQDE
jgi:hypothetical protein